MMTSAGDGTYRRVKAALEEHPCFLRHGSLQFIKPCSMLSSWSWIGNAPATSRLSGNVLCHSAYPVRPVICHVSDVRFLFHRLARARNACLVWARAVLYIARHTLAAHLLGHVLTVQLNGSLSSSSSFATASHFPVSSTYGLHEHVYHIARSARQRSIPPGQSGLDDLPCFFEACWHQGWKRQPVSLLWPRPAEAPRTWHFDFHPLQSHPIQLGWFGTTAVTDDDALMPRTLPGAVTFAPGPVLAPGSQCSPTPPCVIDPG